MKNNYQNFFSRMQIKARARTVPSRIWKYVEGGSERSNTEMCRMGKFCGGYVALIAILIISFIMLSITITTGFEGFWSLSNFSNRESKEISLNLAESCLDQAIVNIIQSPSWRPPLEGEILERGEYFCTIRSLERNSPDVTIETIGEFNKSFTILRAEFNEETLEIVFIEELNN